MNSAVNLSVNPDTLKPVIAAVVEEVLARVEQDRQALPGHKLCFGEAEAAAMLGLLPHVLRDERRRRSHPGQPIVGRRVVYTRDNLLDYLHGRRIHAEVGAALDFRGSPNANGNVRPRPEPHWVPLSPLKR